MICGLFSRAALIVCTACSVVSGSAYATTDPAATITSFYATLLQTMKLGPEAGGRRRYDALAPAVRRSFDLSTMAQMAVGPSWTSLSAVERQGVTEAFSRYTIATYADRFSGYSGQKLEVTDQRSTAYGTIVNSHIVKANGDQVSISYLLRQNDQRWQIADVYFQGGVSQVATLRSQFSAAIQHGGAKELIDTLNRKATSLGS